MSRPKSKTPTKSVTRSVRLTEAAYEKIVIKFGSVQLALNALISKLK